MNDYIQPIPLPPQYSVRIVDSTGSSKVECVDGVLTRVETHRSGLRQIVIGRPDRGVMYIVWPDSSEYRVSPLNGDEIQEAWSPEKSARWRPIGIEQVKGIQCQKFEVFDLERQRVTGFEWIDVATQMRVRHTTVNRMGKQMVQADYEDVVLGPIDVSLFEIPNDFRLIEDQ